MTIKQQIEKLMSRKTGVTLAEVVERGINSNTARRVLGAGHGRQISRKCRATCKYAVAYCLE